jgi:hypothetical protein
MQSVAVAPVEAASERPSWEVMTGFHAQAGTFVQMKLEPVQPAPPRPPSVVEPDDDEEMTVVGTRDGAQLAGGVPP